jgi:hypothetical protein
VFDPDGSLLLALFVLLVNGCLPTESAGRSTWFDTAILTLRFSVARPPVRRLRAAARYCRLFLYDLVVANWRALCSARCRTFGLDSYRTTGYDRALGDSLLVA